MNIYDAMKQRRSRYDLTATSPLSQQRIEEILAQMPFGAPSGEPGAQEYQPIGARLMVQGGTQ